MSQSRESREGKPAGTELNPKDWKKRIGHWTRVAVMFLSGGFIFPHALTEGDDVPGASPGQGSGAERR